MAGIRNQKHYQWVVFLTLQERSFIKNVRAILRRANYGEREIFRTIEPMVSFNRKRLNLIREYEKRNLKIKRRVDKHLKVR